MSKYRFIHPKLLLAFFAVLVTTFMLVPSVALSAPGGSLYLADYEDPLSFPPHFTYGDWCCGGSSSLTTTVQTVGDADPLARPGQVGNNGILQIDYTNTGWVGYGSDTDPKPQDWSSYDAFSFWFKGTGDDTTVYTIEVSDNRSDPNTDTSERFQATFLDTSDQWRYIRIPFSDFVRSDGFQPDGAPNDGFTLTEVWAWALPLPSGGPRTIYIDDVALDVSLGIDDFEYDGALPSGTDGDGYDIGFYTFAGDGTTTVAPSKATPPSDPPILNPVVGNDALGINVETTDFAGVIHAFENETLDTWVSQDWSDYEGIRFWFYGEGSGTDLFIDILENRNDPPVVNPPIDDAQRWTVSFTDDYAGWQLLEFPFSDFTYKPIGTPAPADDLTLLEVHGWAFGTLGTGGARTFYIDDFELYGIGSDAPLTVSFAEITTPIEEGTVGEITVKLNRPMTLDDPASVFVDYASEVPGSTATEGEEYTPVSGTLEFVNGGPTELTFPITTFDDTKFEGNEGIVLRLDNPVDVSLGNIRRGTALIVENDSFNPTLLDDFEYGAYLWDSDFNWTTPLVPDSDPMARPGQDAAEHMFNVETTSAGTFGRDFPIGQDWTGAQALSFWYYGTNSGDEIGVYVKDNRAPDPGPSGWNLVWAEEFNDTAGTPPDPSIWSYEIADTTPDGSYGWGNEELQYYTDDLDNAQMDGNGNLVITLNDADGSQECFYGTCLYESARLISWRKAEFAYGRIEASIQVPDGVAGIWPAFWSLGTDIDQVGWPQTGEIDIMEFVGREPTQIFGTIHGPGYSGGNAFGQVVDTTPTLIEESVHTFAIEWEPDEIRWYFDGNLYHTATPADVAPNEWVFNDPVYLILNVAIGGNFGGTPVDPFPTPQSMEVDYIRVYQGPDTAEVFESSFVDDFTGWQQVTVPFAGFTRSATQPTDAPNDGLNLNDVWGYGFNVPSGGTTSGTMIMDFVEASYPATVYVTNTNDSGPGSLRQALIEVAPGGDVLFDASLAGDTITLTTGPLVPGKDVNIDASDAPGISVDGDGTYRLFEIGAGLNVDIANIILQNGYGYQLAGGILNNGSLTLNHVLLTNNTMTTPDTGQFWQGGGGIYNGENSSLTLIDSTVSNNDSGWAGGGVYSFLGTTTHIERSTVAGNVTADTGAGLRILGDATIINSTISGNTSNGWHGGAGFFTDGTVDVINSTIANNVAPGGVSGGVFVGTFGDSPATLNLTNSIIADNTGSNCFPGYFGGGTVTIASGGYNISNDASCNLAGTGDQPETDPMLEALAENGGPTQTHGLMVGSPAIDGTGAACPIALGDIDQRGEDRLDGLCDIGSFEVNPPVAPTTLQATYDSGAHEVNLTWEDNSSDETGFVVERQKDGATGWETLDTTAADTTTFTDATVTCEQSYIYRVMSANDDGNSSPTVSALVTTECDMFVDVPTDLPAPFMEPWVEDFLQSGITGGKPNCENTSPVGSPTYCPQDNVTRGEVAVFIVRAMEYPNLPYDPPGDLSDPFADVFAGSTALPAPFMEDWIEEFYTRSITGGKGTCEESASSPDLTFCPSDKVTRGEIAVFILKALGITPTNNLSDPFVDVPEDLPAPFMEPWVETFLAEGITSGKPNCENTSPVGSPTYCPQDNVTRAEMAVFILRAFDQIPDPNDP